MIIIVLSTLVLLTAVLSTPSPAQDKVISIGLRAHHGVAKSTAIWQATADYLTEKVEGYTFKLAPFRKLDELSAAASRGEFDFVITNPSSYVEMEIGSGASRMLTLINKRRGQPYTSFGSVIFVRADREDLRDFEDLHGKSLIAVSKPAFGGWRVAWEELLRHGISPNEDLKQLSFAGGIQENVVRAVRDRVADVGVVRTDMLERMQDSGEISLADFRVIGQRDKAEFPFLRSTDLYPEWALASFPKASVKLSKEISQVLLSLPETSAAARDGKYVGWSVPLNYQTVHNLLRTLKVGPYQNYGKVTLSATLSTFRYWIISIAIVLFALLVTGIYAINRNAQLANLRSQLLSDRDRQIKFQRLALDEHAIVSIADVRGNFIEVNDKFCEISGYTRSELLGQNHSILKSDEHSPEFYKDLWKTISSGKPWHGEIKNFTKEKGSYWVKATIVPFLDKHGKPDQYVAIRTDITDRKESEKIKSEFVSTVSHELRTPLTSIKGSLGLIRSGTLGDVTDKAMSMLNIAYNNCDRLVLLINDILDIEKIEAGKLKYNMKTIDIVKFIGEAIEANKGYGVEHGVEFVQKGLSAEIIISGDKDRLMQVMSNLMSNAAKFSPENSQVELEISEDPETVFISVIDSGPGITEDFQSKMFEKFTQADSSDTRQAGGTGLGLGIADSIVKFHRGALDVKSVLGKGSTFTIALPISQDTTPKMN